MTGTAPCADQALSKALFGSSHMLSVIAAISALTTEEFTAPELQEATGLPASTVHGLVTRLLQIGLISRTRATSTDRVVRYVTRKPKAISTLAYIRDAE